MSPLEAYKAADMARLQQLRLLGLEQAARKGPPSLGRPFLKIAPEGGQWLTEPCSAPTSRPPRTTRLGAKWTRPFFTAA